MEATVRTIILATGEIHDERQVLLNTQKGREWLLKHLWFCMTNGMGVQVFRSDEQEPV